MIDVFTKRKRSAVMSLIRSADNASTELRLITLMHGRGITGWRRRQTLPGRPDFVFRHGKLAVFVDGCFWHGCPLHHRLPATRPAFWLAKLQANRARDRRVGLELRQNGWRVLRIWECDLTKARQPLTAARLKRALRGPTAFPIRRLQDN
jgi:DNA mismatch endonuclease (patch repair protein)